MWVMDTVTYVVRPVGSTPWPTRLKARPATTASTRASAEATAAVPLLPARVTTAVLSSEARRRRDLRTGQAQGSRLLPCQSSSPFTSYAPEPFWCGHRHAGLAHLGSAPEPPHLGGERLDDRLHLRLGRAREGSDLLELGGGRRDVRSRVATGLVHARTLARTAHDTGCRPPDQGLGVPAGLLRGRHGLLEDLALLGACLTQPVARVPADVLDHLLGHQLGLAEQLHDLPVDAVTRSLEVGQLRAHALELALEALVVCAHRPALFVGGLDLVGQEVEVLVDLVGVQSPHPAREVLVADGRGRLVLHVVRHWLSPDLLRTACGLCSLAAA